MATIDDAAVMALELAEVTEGEHRGNRTWQIAGKGFAWVRPFSKADLRRFGDAIPPDGPILAVRVEDLGEKEAVLAANRGGFFTIPHFEGYPAVLIELRKVPRRRSETRFSTGGWRARHLTSRRNTSTRSHIKDVGPLSLQKVNASLQVPRPH